MRFLIWKTYQLISISREIIFTIIKMVRPAGGVFRQKRDRERTERQCYDSYQTSMNSELKRSKALRVSIYFLAKTCPPSFNEIFRTADSRLILFLPACLSTQGVYKKVNDSWPPCTCTALSAAELWIFETIYLKFNKSDFALIFTIRFEF